MKYNVIRNKNIKNFNDLLSACIGKALANQLMFSKICVFNSKWSLDFENKTIFFEDINRIFKMEIIGTELLTTNTWLWAHADLNIPQDLTHKSKLLKELGLKYNLDVLYKDGFFLNDYVKGKSLALIASVLDSDNTVYYRGAFKGGYIYIYVYGLPKNIFYQLNVKETIILFNQIRLKYDLNEKLMVQSFLELNTNVIALEKKKIEALYGDGSRLIVNFNDDKISKMYIISKKKQGQ